MEIFSLLHLRNKNYQSLGCNMVIFNEKWILYDSRKLLDRCWANGLTELNIGETIIAEILVVAKK